MILMTICVVFRELLTGRGISETGLSCGTGTGQNRGWRSTVDLTEILEAEILQVVQSP